MLRIRSLKKHYFHSKILNISRSIEIKYYLDVKLLQMLGVYDFENEDGRDLCTFVQANLCKRETITSLVLVQRPKELDIFVDSYVCNEYQGVVTHIIFSNFHDRWQLASVFKLVLSIKYSTSSQLREKSKI